MPRSKQHKSQIVQPLEKRGDNAAYTVRKLGIIFVALIARGHHWLAGHLLDQCHQALDMIAQYLTTWSAPPGFDRGQYGGYRSLDISFDKIGIVSSGPRRRMLTCMMRNDHFDLRMEPPSLSLPGSLPGYPALKAVE